jgi:mono/diheme cytochrome c family protein
MKRTLITLGALALGIGTIAAGDAGTGKDLFVANKCNVCHGISAQGIAKTMAASKAPDLSKAGKSANAATLKAYLMKTAQINGKNHSKKWAGSDADLQTVANWLASLK